MSGVVGFFFYDTPFNSNGSHFFIALRLDLLGVSAQYKEVRSVLDAL